MSFTDDYNALKKKRKKQEKEKVAASGGTKFEKQYYTAAVDREPVEDIAPVRKTTDAPVLAAKTAQKQDTRKWFEKGAFEDGYQFGDVIRAISSSSQDLGNSITAGLLGIGEKAVDAGAYIVGGAAGLLGNDELKEKTEKFIEKDLYDEEKIAKKINAPSAYISNKILGIDDVDEGSVLGEKTDALAQSGGQLLGTAALQAVGVPWYLTSGVTSFGSEAEGALNEGATFGEAGASAAISAGAEILTEKLFGGSGLGEKGLINLEALTGGISSKAVKLLADYGVDMAAEGSEEVISQFMSNLGSALYKEENLGELLASEEALDGYLESFIGGAALGGVANVGKVIHSAQTGRDYRTELTESEQSVVDRVYEERVAEAENQGEKLSKKDKDEIYNSVLEDMERGYIDTDTIESVLGGETYKSYRDTVEGEDALQSEFDALNKMKQGEMTGEQIDRRAELKEKLAEIKQNSQRDTLKAQLGEEVFGLAQGSRLSESYAERARRGQVFEADLSKYDDKQKAVIQKAIDSGILNNTNRTHEFVDMVAKISADKGVLFDFTNNEKLKGSSFAVDGAAVNGFITKDGITVNIDSRKAVNSVVGHEITHVLEGTELYTELQTALFEYAKGKGDYQGRYDTLAKLYEGVEGADVDAELTADLVGDYLFTDSDFINSLSTKHRNVFQKVYDEVKYLCKIATAGSKEARELEKVKRAFEKAYRESGKVSSDTKYSLSDSNIADETTGYASGETYFTMSYKQDGKVVGTLEYGEYDGEPNVKMIEVAPEYRRQGIGTRLLQELQKKYPDTEIDFGMSTPDGTKLLDAITYDVTDEAVVADRQKLKDLQTELSDLQEKLDVLYDTEILTEAQETELHELGDRWQEVYETIHELEKSVRGKRATKTFVKTDTKYSLSDSDGKQLTKEQGEYFKDSKMRDDNGNLKVMYHGSQDAGFHIFDPSMSDDGTSLFFVDRNDVATTYSGTSETYAPRVFKSAEDANNFLKEMGFYGGKYGYEVVENNGEFTLFAGDEEIATSKNMAEIYEEFCDYEGVGYGDANYKVYLNLTNPLEIDAKGRPWNKIDAEFSQETYDRYTSLTAEEKAALTDLAEWEDFSLFNREIQEAKGDALASAYAKMGEDVNIYDLFSVAADNFSEESMRENSRRYLKTRDYAQRAKAEGYDGVIIKNVHDNGGYSNGDEGASTVAIAFSSEQVKSVANEKPTGDPDIRYSLSEGQQEYFKDSKVRDEDGKLKAVYHGSPSDFNEFSLKYLGANGTNEGYGFYFTDSKRIADGYSKGENGNGKLFEVYLDIKKPLSDKEVTISRAQFKKLLVALNNQVDADGERLDILSNYGDVEWEGLNKVLNYAIELEYDGNDNDVDIISSLVNSSGNLETVYRVLREVTGYDGIIVNEAEWGGDQTIYIAFHPEQIKNVDNLNPTSDPDIRRSLSAEGETPKQYGKWNIYGKDIRYTPTELAPVQDSVQDVQDSVQDAPVAEDAPDIVDDVPDIEPREPSLQEMRERQDALYEELEAAIAREDAEAFSRIGEEYNRVAFAVQQMEADEAERLSSIDDADAPPEVDAPYYEDEAAEVADPFDDRDIKAVGDRKVKAYMYENPEVKPFFQEEANILLGELREGTKGERIYTPTPDGQPGVYGSDSYGIWHGVKRHVSPDIEYLLDTVKMSYADIEKGLRAIIEDHGAENIAAAKKIEFVLNDRLLKGYQEQTLGAEIPPNQDYINLINEKQITAYTDEARHSFFESVGATDIKPEVEDIAPVAEKYEAIRPRKQTAEPRMKRAEPRMKRVKEVEDDGKVAEVLTDEPKVNKQRTSAWAMFKNNVLDKGMVFEDLALETGNRELQARWNSIRYAEGKAQRLMEKGKANISSLKSIRETVEKSGKTQQFYEYLYHLHNVDRMSLEGRGAESIAKWRDYFKGLSEKQIQAIAAKEITDSTTEKTADGIRGAREYLNALDTKNKPVFGDSVTAEVSKETAAELESANPEFVEWSSEVYSYMNYLREELVANGVISRDTAKLWAEIYPHYVPIRRAGKDGAAINVPLDTGRTGINAPIKRATGGNSDILPLFDTMGQRTIQTYRAIAKNRFGVELKNTLGTTIGNEAAGVDDTIDSIDTDEGLLQEGKDGNAPTFTVFENGERVTFEITEEMYDAMKPTSKGLSYTNKVANTVGSVFRGLLTEYNPVFMTTNAVKDVQDILINSQHAARTYVNIPNAIAQMASGGRWYREYLDNGGERNTYFDNHSNTFKAEDNAVKKIVGMPLRIISGANNFIERVPRLAEYIASRKAGRSIDVSMLDAARVTTNFAAGGDLTKMLNRNGFNFLNASTQGAIQQVRNVREAKANGLRGWVQLAAKVTLAGLPALLLNDLLWDDDEEYEELADYVKDNYYIVAKYGDGQFVRIPKGRTLAVIQDAFEQMRNKITGDDEVDLKSFLDLAITNLAPNNPLDNNIIAPISQALSNRTWYGEDLVPTRLQDLPAAEQYDESTDSISKWLGERLDVSPYKLNYLLNQYSGGVGDVVLPMLTPETDGGGILAPFTDKFTTDSVLNNQNVSDFYDTMDELTRNAKSSKATDEDILSYKYMNSVNAELGELYAEKREIQNSDLSDRAKLDAVRSIQEKIDSITRESLDAYGKVNIQGKYATVGDLHYKWYEPGEDSDTEPGWQKISDKQLQKQNEVTRGLGISASEYWSNKEEYDYAYDNPEKYAVAKSVGGYSAYKSYQSELYDIKADKDESGKSISGSRKEKVIDYVNGLDIDYGARLVLFKSEYNADDTYNYEIIDYLNSREDISYEDTVTILKELGFTVDSEGNIYW